MKPPRCRLCREEHRLGPCPSFYAEPSRVTPRKEAESPVRKVVQVSAQRAKAAAGAINAQAINTINRAAINAARGSRASNHAGFPQEKRNGDRTGRGRKREVPPEHLSGSGAAVAEVVGAGPSGVQRGLQRDGGQSADISAPEAGKDVAKPLENHGVERGVDGSLRGEVSQNGRSRAAYNAYMRGYMARRRAAGRVA